MTYFRAQTANRDPQDLIDADRNQISYSWYGHEGNDRPGVSVCESRDALAYYLANSGLPIGDGEWVVVELEGDVVDGAKPMDAEFGEILVWPTEIVAVTPLDDEMFDMIGAAYDALG